MGPRLGRFDSKCQDSQELVGHSVPVSVKRFIPVALAERCMAQKLRRVRESFGKDRENLV